MKKYITFDELAVCFCSAVAYGFGFLIPEHLGCPFLVSLAICFIPGLIVEAIAEKIVFSRFIQERRNSRVITRIGCILFFLAGSAIALYFFGQNLNEDLGEEFLYAIGIPIASFVVSLIVYRAILRKMREKYGDGSGGYIVSQEYREFIQGLNGENKRITGEYDAKNAVRTQTGTYVGKREFGVLSFLGIPYAMPPVGERRWKKPMPLPETDAVFEAYRFGASELQPENEANPLNFHRQSEDCLTLNVWKAEKQKNAGRCPVVVYFHDGDFISGGSANPIGYGESFVRSHSDVVFVSINYRFGLFGYIDFSEVEGGSEYPDAPNCGLLDQIEALKWVKRNVSAFGGDPENITLMGTGAGGTCALLLATIEAARGLFRKIIVLSASPEFVAENAQSSIELGKALAGELDAASMDELAQVPAEELKGAAGKYLLMGCSPSCGCELLPENVQELFERGVLRDDLELMIGLPKSEFSNAMAFSGQTTIHGAVESLTDAFRSCYSDEKQREILELLGVDKPVDEMQDDELGKIIGDVLYVYAPLHIAGILAGRGKKVYAFLWDVVPNIEKMQANAASFLATVLDNFLAGEQLGYISDPALTEVTQCLMSKFLSGEEMRLYHNELRGFDEINWPLYSRETRSVMRFNQGRIEVLERFLGEKADAIDRLQGRDASASCERAE